MAIKSKLMGLGMSALQAQVAVGTVTSGLTGGGASQATATLLSDDVNVCVTAGAGYFVLRGDLTAGDTQTLVNYSGSTVSVLPPAGGKINNGAVNAAASQNSPVTAVFTCLDGVNFARVLSY